MSDVEKPKLTPQAIAQWTAENYRPPERELVIRRLFDAPPVDPNLRPEDLAPMSEYDALMSGRGWYKPVVMMTRGEVEERYPSPKKGDPDV